MTGDSIKVLTLAAGLAAMAGAVRAAEPAGAFQLAQVMATPAGCHWIDAGDRAQDLWCRGEDGRAVRTSTSRRDTRSVADTGCPPGRLDDGFGCAPEAVVASRGSGWTPTTPRPQVYQKAEPQILLGGYGDGYGYGYDGGRRRDGYVIHHPPGSPVSVMTPIRRRR
jgi:hypothetical protein